MGAAFFAEAFVPDFLDAAFFDSDFFAEGFLESSWPSFPFASFEPSSPSAALASDFFVPVFLATAFAPFPAAFAFFAGDFFAEDSFSEASPAFFPSEAAVSLPLADCALLVAGLSAPSSPCVCEAVSFSVACADIVATWDLSPRFSPEPADCGHSSR